MPFIGNKPTAVPLTSADLEDSIVTSAKITDGTIALADLSATGTKDATTFLRGDNTFASAGGGGKVLQVVSNSSSTTISTSSSSDTEVINTSITPSSTSSKILVIASLSVSIGAATNAYAGSKLRRGTNTGTIISEKGTGDSYEYDLLGFIDHSILDSPSTTSSQQYTMSFRKASSNTSSVSTDGRVYNIILMEIGA
jgi:hypothetical protein